MRRILPLWFAGGCFFAISGEMHAAAPTGITLSSNTVKENSLRGTLLCTISAVDPDPGDSHVFSLVAGPGSEDNTDFRISGNQLYLDYDIPGDYEVEGDEIFFMRLRVTDSTSLSYEQAFLIYLSDDLQEDNDGDGMTQEQELALGLSDQKFDTDGDGVGDAVELAAGTSPTDASVWPPATLAVGWGKANEGEQSMPWAEEFTTLVTEQNHSLAMNASGGIVGWGGHNDYGQITPPAGMADVVALAAGGDFWLEDSAHSLALKSDGTVVGWGFNQDEMLAVPTGLEQVIAIDAGRSHCIALKDDGTVVTWGTNPFGTIETPSGLDDVVAVAAGGFHCLALKGDGSVVAWGSNFDGVEWKDAWVPVGLADVVAISAGRFHSLALKGDGTVVAWGYNVNGQANVPAGLEGVVAVAAGGFHNLALKDDGSVVAWGLNSRGQATVPTAARSGIKLVSAGVLHSLALRQPTDTPEIISSPRILSAPGQLVAHQVLVNNPGNSAAVFSAVGLPPGLVIDSETGIISGTVTTGARRSVRIKVKIGQRVLTQSAWVGISEGLPPTSVVLTPAAVMENSNEGVVVGTLSASDPDAGDTHTFEWVDGVGSTDNGMFRIEGDQLILNTKVTRDFESNPAGFSIRVRARDASLNPFEQVIALQFLDDLTEDADGDGLTEQEESANFTSDATYDSDGDGFGDGFEIARGTLPKAAGSFPSGRLAMAWGNPADGRTIPPAGLENIVDFSAGGLHSLALKSDGSVVSWGENVDGQSTVPLDLGRVIAVEAGKVHSMVLKSDGTVRAWGNNISGQTDIPEGLGGVVSIAAGGFHNLALKGDGTVIAWGFNEHGQATVPDGLTNVVAVAAGGFHSLALKSDGTVVAWGWADYISVPEELGGVIAIAAGGSHSLALKHDGTVVAWGSNDKGQLTIPVGLGNVTAISAGWQHSLALKADGTMAAWGDNTKQQANVPIEAHQIRRIDAGDFHNLVIRQNSGFPSFADVTPVRGWPGETVAKPMMLQNAAANPNPTGPLFSAMGLPADLAMNPVNGLVSGTVITGECKAVRISADTNQGMLNRVVWYDTMHGVAPTAISLSANILAENSPVGTVVGNVTVTDPNVGDSHTFEMEATVATPESFRFVVSNGKLVVQYSPAANFDAGVTQITIRVVAVDSGNNTFKQDFVLLLTDDRTEDGDGDGISEAMEEDVFGTSDSQYDNPNTADADHDGVPGMLEYAFNLNPKLPGPLMRLVAGAGSTAGLPAIDLVEDGQGHHRLRMEYLRRIGDGLIYMPQFASDLNPSAWELAAAPTVTAINAEWERCVVVDAQSIETAPRRFGRVALVYVDVNRTQDSDGDGISQAMEEDVFGTSDSVINDFATENTDHDGVPSMIEYAFNLDPKVAGPPLRLVAGAGSTAGLPSITLVDAGEGKFRLRIEYIRRIGDFLTYVPQFTGGLDSADWKTAGNPVSVTAMNGEWERCVVEDTQTTSDASRRFARVAVSW